MFIQLSLTVMYIKNDRSELIFSLLDDISGIKVITDLGCMDGATLNGMASKMPLDVDYFGVDHVNSSFDPNSDVVSYKECDLNSNLSELQNILMKTDLLLLLDVLEHLYNPEKFLSDIQKLMKPRSTMVITVPNASSVRKLYAWLINDFPREDIGYFDRTHRSWFTPKSLQKITPEDFYVNKTGYIYSKKVAFSFFQKLLPSRFTSQFFIKITKK